MLIPSRYESYIVFIMAAFLAPRRKEVLSCISMQVVSSPWEDIGYRGE